MSFDTKLLLLDPSIYIPMDDREERVPKEIIGDSTIAVFGNRPTFLPPELFLTDLCKIDEDSYLSVDLSSLSPYSEYTYGLWFRTGSSESDIFDMRTATSGSAINVRQNKIRFNFNGNQSKVIADLDPETIYFSCVVFDGNSIKFYLNGIQESQDSHNAPAIGAATLGGRSSGSKVGSCEISGVFWLDYRLESDLVKDLFDVGSKGFSIRNIDSESSVSISENRVDLFQTSWQAYGIVVVKD